MRLYLDDSSSLTAGSRRDLQRLGHNRQHPLRAGMLAPLRFPCTSPLLICYLSVHCSPRINQELIRTS